MVRTQVYGHRGMGCSTSLNFSQYPENSLTSFGKALECGADGVEFDVFLTDFGEVVVCHGDPPDGLAFVNLLLYENGQLTNFPRDLSVENLKVSHKNVVLRVPWTYQGVKTNEEMCHLVSKLSNTEKETLNEQYFSSTEGYNPENSTQYECLPTLEDVFQKFGNKLKYNVELKGTKVELGSEVLKVVAKFPGLDVLVSSFQWSAPPLSPDSPFSHSNSKVYSRHGSNLDKNLDKNVNKNSDKNADEVEEKPDFKLEHELELEKEKELEKERQLETNPNPNKVDLLGPLVNNTLNVPLALLFYNNDSLPSFDRFLEFVNKYKATYVNVPDAFWLKKKPVLGCELKGENVLNTFVKKMHENNVKVLTWSASPFDYQKFFHVYLDARVDVVCVNAVAEVVAFNKSYHSTPN